MILLELLLAPVSDCVMMAAYFKGNMDRRLVPEI